MEVEMSKPQASTRMLDGSKAWLPGADARAVECAVGGGIEERQ